MILALVNTDIIWESSNENLLNCDRIISELIHNVNHTVDIVIFPEFFTTGFSMNPKIAQNMSGDVLNWMKRKSKESKIAILSSVSINEGDNIYNRALFVTPHGDVYHYDKRHLLPDNDPKREVYLVDTLRNNIYKIGSLTTKEPSPNVVELCQGVYSTHKDGWRGAGTRRCGSGFRSF